MPSNPTLVIAGNPSPIELPLRSVWNLTGGASHERRWWGQADAVKAMINSAIAGGAIDVTFDQDRNSPIGILTAKYSGTGPGSVAPTESTETVDFDETDTTISWDRNPTFISLSTAKVQEIEKAISEKKATNPYTAGTLEYRAFELRRRGTDSYRAVLPVVVWNRTVGPKYPAISDLDNCGKIFSTTNLAYSIGAPLLFRIPTGNVGISSDNSTGFTAGWMKTGKVTSSNGQSQITLRAEYGLWENELYQFA